MLPFLSLYTATYNRAWFLLLPTSRVSRHYICLRQFIIVEQIQNLNKITDSMLKVFPINNDAGIYFSINILISLL